MRVRFAVWTLIAVSTFACNTKRTGLGFAEDTGVADTGVADTSVADSSVADTGVADSSVADSSVADSSVVDSSVVDSSVVDSSVVDSSVVDSSVVDSSVVDSSVVDAGGCVPRGAELCGNDVDEDCERGAETCNPSDCTVVEMSATSHVYWLCTARRNWPEGAEPCRMVGGRLASFSAVESMRIASVLGSRIGAQGTVDGAWIDLIRGSDWGWSSSPGTAIDNNWDVGEPNLSGSCGRLMSNGRWRDSNCSDRYPALCERD